MLCKRTPYRTRHPGAWDLPGGRVLTGEQPEAALARELREELGIIVDPPSGPARAGITVDGVALSVWLIDEWVGEPRNADPYEHETVAWFRPDEVPWPALAHPDYIWLFRQLGLR